MEPDGRFVLLGRDSLVVNTGGEKVFVEEVEDALKRCDGVRTRSSSVGPSPRFGQAVVAIVRSRRVARADPAALRDQCSEQIARYKAPRAFLFVERPAPPERQGRLLVGARSTSERATDAS